MFEIKKRKWLNNHDAISIINEKQQLQVTVLPQLGAMINSFSSGELDVIDGINLDQNGLEEYFTTYKSSFLMPFPNRIAGGEFEYRGNKHSLLCNEAERGNALHGFLHDKPFNVLDTLADEIQGTIKLSYFYEGTISGFPYPFEVTITYNLIKSGRLICTTEIENSGNTTLPFGTGWHHYFRMNEPVNELNLSFEPNQKWILGEKMIPTLAKESVSSVKGLIAEANYDDCFTLQEPIVTLSNKTGRILEINCDEQYPYLQIYTPPHRKSIAIEPMTCPPDVLNNKIDLIELPPGEKKSVRFSMLIK